MGFGLCVALAGALIAAGPTALVPSARPRRARDAFDRGRTAFERAEYRRAIEILNPLLYPEMLLDSEGEQVQAHRMLGVAYLFESKPDEAAARVQEAAGAAPRLPLRSAARLAARGRLLQRRPQGRGGDDREDEGPPGRARQERRQGRERDASACMPPTISATNGIRSRSPSSRSAPGSFRTASGARAGGSSGRVGAGGDLGGRVHHQLRALRGRARSASATS